MSGYIKQRYKTTYEAKQILDCFLNAEKVELAQDVLDRLRIVSKTVSLLASTLAEKKNAIDLHRLVLELDEILFDEEYIDNTPEPEGGTNDLE